MKRVNSDLPEVEVINPVEVLPDNKDLPTTRVGANVANAVADNLPQIISIISEIVTIRKRRVEGQIEIQRMEQARLDLIEETNRYVAMKKAETDRAISKATIIQSMMKDYMQNQNPEITPEVFREYVQLALSQFNEESL
jgi:hypothetical protein